MENVKTLSVITVTYNAEKTLERTVASVKEQTYPFIQHVIVDGNSADGTIDIIRRHANKKMKWVSEPDKGLYYAMNKAAVLADGDYLCFLNAGDTFHSDETVGWLMSDIEFNLKPDIIYGETAIVDDGGNFLHMRRLRAPERLNYKSFKKGMLVCHQSFIVRKRLFEPYDTSYRFSSDFDWAICMMRKSTDIFNANIIITNYLNEGLTTKNRKASLKERFNIMVKHYGLMSTLLYHAWFVVRAIFKR